MPTPPAGTATVTSHPGSSTAEIAAEPNWGSGHQHRVGYINTTGRRAGLTHEGDHEPADEDERAFIQEATRKYRELRARAKKGDLVNFVDVMKAQTVSSLTTAAVHRGYLRNWKSDGDIQDYHRHLPEVYPPGWRFVVRATEDEIKYKQDWPGTLATFSVSPRLYDAGQRVSIAS